MNNIIKRTWNQNRMVTIEDLRGMAFQAESGGHTFEISGINDANEAVSLSGTVAGVFMRPDGADVALTGTASDGVVSVTLSDACYAVAGRFGLYIFVTSDSKKTCVYACIGTVAQTSYGTVAGDTPQDVVDLINAINAAIASIPADYSDLMAAIAPTYSDQSVYPAGAYRWYNGVLYKSKVEITTAEAWTAAHWASVALADDVETLKNATAELDDGHYEAVEKIATVTGAIAYIIENNNYIGQANRTGQAYNVYRIEKDKRYKIYGFGYDRSTFYVACTASVDISQTGVAVTGGLENIACGTDVYPSGYAYHTIEFTASEDCYLYINYKQAESEATLGVFTRNLTVKTAESVKNAIKKINSDYGIYKDGDTFYHFNLNGENYIIRRFTHIGPNNLLQWSGLFLGTVDESGVNITETVANYTTDVVGPISLFNTTLYPNVYGMWTGGNHSVTVDGVAYATAEEEEFECLVNGTEITNDGLYYGDVTLRTKNKLYFPQSITGSDLSTARLALNEYRCYHLDKQMKVCVRLEFVENCRISAYYGIQMITLGFDDIFCANNEYYAQLSDITEITYLQEKERKVYFTNADGLHFDVELINVGLGEYTHNDGWKGYFYIANQSSVHKAYYEVICDQTQKQIDAGTNVVVEGKYSLYF